MFSKKPNPKLDLTLIIVKPALIKKTAKQDKINETAYLMKSEINVKRIDKALKTNKASTTYKSLEELKRACKI